MIVTRPESLYSNRRAYALIELVVASFLTIQIGMVLVLTWKAFGVSALQVEERARLTVNANLAVESLARDLSGYQVKIEGRTGPTDQNLVYRLFRFQSPPIPTDAYPLQLLFKREDQATNPRTLTISYYVDSVTYEDSVTYTLIRLEEDSGDLIPNPVLFPMSSARTAVATHVTKLEVAPYNSTSSTISFTVSYRDFTGMYILYMQYPP